MVRSNEICNEVAKDVRSMINQALELGDDSVYYEKEYGDAFIGVDIRPVNLRNGFYMMVTDVFVSHCDTRHESPLLTEAVRKAIPDWDELEKEYNNNFRKYEKN